jgi:heme O synthase-like polyprenyltransferase
VVGDARAARAILISAVLLVTASIVPFFFDRGIVYLLAASAGGAYFLAKCVALVRRPMRMPARTAFLASLAQLCAVLFGAMLDVAIS